MESLILNQKEIMICKQITLFLIWCESHTHLVHFDCSIRIQGVVSGDILQLFLLFSDSWHLADNELN